LLLGIEQAIDTEDALRVVRRIPGDIENDHTVGGHQIDAQATGPSGDEKQAGAQVGHVVELFAHGLALLHAAAAVQSEVILSVRPAALKVAHITWG